MPRALPRIALVLLALQAFGGRARAEPDLPQLRERFRLELILAGERHFATFIASAPSGGEDRLAARWWTGGFDLCPAAVVRPYLHLGGCLGLHIGANLVPPDHGQWFADETPSILARGLLRATFRTPAWFRGGVDLMLRSYLDAGRETALEAGVRVGLELPRDRVRTPLFLELIFRAPLVSLRSDSTYGWPRYDAEGSIAGYDLFPTRSVRIFTFGVQLGTYWSALGPSRCALLSASPLCRPSPASRLPPQPVALGSGSPAIPTQRPSAIFASTTSIRAVARWLRSSATPSTTSAPGRRTWSSASTTGRTRTASAAPTPPALPTRPAPTARTATRGPTRRGRCAAVTCGTTTAPAPWTKAAPGPARAPVARA